MTNLLFMKLLGVVGSNTPAFKAYAMSLLPTQANLINKEWHLGLPQEITSNQVTQFVASQRTNGLTGSIVVDGRYAFMIADQRFERFADLHFNSRSLRNLHHMERLASMEDRLTTWKALRMGKNKLAALGILPGDLELEEPRIKHEDLDENVMLPL